MMVKYIYYDGKYLRSLEIDGNPYVDMRALLEHIVPDSWEDYQQVLNSSADMQFDLNIKFVDDVYLLPVQNVSSWLFAFTLRNMKNTMYNRFRVFRRDVEKVYRVAWALPVEDLVTKKQIDVDWPDRAAHACIYELIDLFQSFEIPEDRLTGTEEVSPIEYIEHVVGCKECGPRGMLLYDTIQYIRELPNSSSILNCIDDYLFMESIPGGEYLDSFLDNLNSLVSSIASRFVGEM